MLSPTTFTERRAALVRALPTGLIVLLGNGPAPMNYAANLYPFRQDGSFLYYTGIDAPGFAVAIDADAAQSTLFGREASMEDRVWDGERPSVRERASAAGMARTATPEGLADAVGKAKRAGQAVHVLAPYRGDAQIALAALLGVAPDEIEPSQALIDAVVGQRLVKTEAEVAEIERALAIAAEMHAVAMRTAQPGATEFEVHAEMEAVAARHGSYPPFPPIVTVRGEVAHHKATGHVLEDGDLLLHDAGAVAPGTLYTADITRVSPVGGTFSDRQRAVYQIVLDAQEACISACTPGASFRDIHDLASKTIARGLVGLGLMRGDPDEIVAAGAHALFFTHGLGHPMGLDVHDLEGLGEDHVGYAGEAERSDQFGTRYLRFARELRPGYVMTVEPGVYFNGALIEMWKSEGRHTAFVDYDEAERWVGFGGVRIEDDIVVTEDGHRVLGPHIPKTVAEVEAAVQEGASVLS